MTINLFEIKRVTDTERDRNVKLKQKRERALRHKPKRADVTAELEAIRAEDQRPEARTASGGT